MTEESIIRRKRLDHERYLRNREQRLAQRREYYIAHKAEILACVRLRRLGLYERPPIDEKAREERKERKRQYDRRYYWEHRDEALAKARKRRDAKKSA